MDPKQLDAQIQKIFPHGYTSYSQIESYQRCPHYFYKRYVLRTETVSNFYAQFGTVIHLIMEIDTQEQLKHGFHIPKDIAITILNCFWKHNDMLFDTVTREQEYYEKGLQVIDYLVNRPIILGMPGHKKIVGTEVEFFLSVPSFYVPIKGYIDKVYRDPDGGLVVVDYKTAKTPYDQQKIDTALQMSIYGMACKQIYGEYPKRYEYDFVCADKIISTTRQKPDILAAGMIIQHTILSMLNEIFEDRYDNNFWCRNLCDVGKLGLC